MFVLEVQSKEQLVRHTSKVRTLLLSADGSFLLSAAGGEVVVWDLKGGLHRAINTSNGLVTALVWVPMSSGASAAFALGCRDRLIHLFRRTGEQPLFLHSASVRLDDGGVAHLGYNMNFRCIAGLAVGSEDAQVWRVEEEGLLTAGSLPDNEPAFPEGPPKPRPFRQEISHRYANGDHILVRVSNEWGVIDLLRWGPPKRGLIRVVLDSLYAVFPVNEFGRLVFDVTKVIIGLICAILVILALCWANILPSDTLRGACALISD